MTEPQAYMLIGTLWIILSSFAHSQEAPGESIMAALVGAAFFGAAVWVAV